MAAVDVLVAWLVPACDVTACVLLPVVAVVVGLSASAIVAITVDVFSYSPIIMIILTINEEKRLFPGEEEDRPPSLHEPRANDRLVGRGSSDYG